MAVLSAADNEQSPDWGAKVLAVLTATLTLLTPVLAAGAAAAGGVSRMLRNEQGLALAAFVLMLAGFIAAALAFIVLTGTSTTKTANSTRLLAAASILIAFAPRCPSAPTAQAMAPRD